MTLYLFAKLGIVRFRAGKRGEVRLEDIALTGEPWPEGPKKVANSLLNQFQLPVLFYLLCVLLLITNFVDIIHLVLAWGFVLSRLVHAYIHVGSNDVMKRFSAFLVGVIALSIMWTYFTVSFVVKSI